MGGKCCRVYVYCRIKQVPGGLHIKSKPLHRYCQNRLQIPKHIQEHFFISCYGSIVQVYLATKINKVHFVLLV